jgi:CRP-like cAMP-binding protein
MLHAVHAYQFVDRTVMALMLASCCFQRELDLRACTLSSPGKCGSCDHPVRETRSYCNARGTGYSPRPVSIRLRNHCDAIASVPATVLRVPRDVIRRTLKEEHFAAAWRSELSRKLHRLRAVRTAEPQDAPASASSNTLRPKERTGRRS